MTHTYHKGHLIVRPYGATGYIVPDYMEDDEPPLATVASARCLIDRCVQDGDPVIIHRTGDVFDQMADYLKGRLEE